jgi:hypothetical protein
MGILKKLNKDKEKNKKEEASYLVLTDRAIDILLDLFETPEWALSYEYIKDRFKEHGYRKPDRVIRDLVNEGILQIDTFEPELLFALTEYGIGLWEEMFGEH